MRIVALTGSVAAGKTTVAEMFRRWGATIFDADQTVRELQAPGMPVFNAMTARFGQAILRSDGGLDRSALRRLILSNPVAKRDLEAIVHPEVERARHDAIAVARSRGARVVIADIPLLFEAGNPADYDGVIVVDAPDAERLHRLVRHRRLAPDEAEQLMAAQIPPAEKRARATWVIENGGNRAQLEARAGEVWQALLR